MLRLARRRNENVCPFSLEFEACVFYDMCERKDKNKYDACKKAKEIFGGKLTLEYDKSSISEVEESESEVESVAEEQNEGEQGVVEK